LLAQIASNGFLVIF